MVGFKDWSDYNQFMQEYAVCCCQNCVGYSHKQDINSGRFVCMRTMSPVRLDITNVCVEWQNEDGKVLDDYDKDMFPFKFSETVWEKLIHMDEDLSFEELVEVIDNEEH